MTVIFSAEKFGLSKSTPYYLSGQIAREGDIETWQITLTDGSNQLTDREIELIKSHPDTSALELMGVITFGDTPKEAKEETPPPPPSDPINIFNLSIAKAEPVIKAETNIQLLKQWLTDPRTGIKDLVGDRLLELGEMPDV